MGSSSKARIPRDKATKLLSDLLKAAVRCNSLPDRAYEIEEIWLFGSHLRGAETVGDIDLVIRWNSRPGMDIDDLDQRTLTRFRQLYPNAGWIEVWDMAKRLQDRDLYGERRNSAYAVDRDIQTLIAMAEPCMMVFSLADGIISAPVVLDRHPDAATRNASIRPRVTEEDRDRLLALRPSARPIPADWSCTANGDWSPGPSMFALGHTTGGFYHVERLVNQFHNGASRYLKVYGHEDHRRLAEGNLAPLPDMFNGRELALITTAHKNIVLQRSMDFAQPGTVIYNLTASDYTVPGVTPETLSPREVAAYQDIIGYYLASLVYADTLCTRKLDPSIEMIHFFAGMDGNEAIEARMRYWAAHLVKSTPIAFGAAA